MHWLANGASNEKKKRIDNHQIEPWTVLLELDITLANFLTFECLFKWNSSGNTSLADLFVFFFCLICNFRSFFFRYLQKSDDLNILSLKSTGAQNHHRIKWWRYRLNVHTHNIGTFLWIYSNGTYKVLDEFRFFFF